MAGEAILVNIVTEILKKLGSFALEEINLAKGAKKELKKLQTTILMIEAVISDAEYKQVKDKSVGIWLKELKGLAYEADDILDEYAYDLMHQRQGLDHKRDKVRNFISISSNPIARSSKMGHEIKDLNKKFDELARLKVGLGLQTIGVGSSSHSHTMGVDGINRETYASVDESKVLGREVDKSNIINMLLANNPSCNQNDEISVIPIVGMGGLGKTTLAQFVYKDTVVQSHFNLKIWVCVSEVFDLTKIFLNITKSIPGANIDAGSDLNFIVNQLEQHLNGKSFLLVLDDVWNEKYGEWNKLKVPLMVGAKGSKILVTTRSGKVASIVLAGEFPSYKLQNLEDDICLSIFEQRAFGSSLEAIKPPTLVEIGKELVRKCGGLPLAAEALGSLMRSKKEVSEWEVIRDSEIWKNNPENPNEILPVLKLSYDHLSPQVKQCFSYCSLFPKDSEIEIKYLIGVWVAEGFIQPSSKEDKRLLEEIGYEYFQILLWNSFFQGVEVNKYGEITYFKMHDLIHDLAQSVAGTHECVVVTEAIEMRDISEFRRLNLLNVNEESFDADAAAALVLKSKLRALFIKGGRIKDIGRLFNSHRKLRVLDLSDTDIEELPPSIGDLKHLRYLDLSDCWRLKKLPDSITQLYNLQTLNLKGCTGLKKFPKDLNRLINLRHLVHDLSDWQLKVGQLTCLQTLKGFGVPKDMFGIGELQCLNLLGGKLEISCLERVRGRENAEKANLKAKKFIKQLNLRWGDEVEDGDEYSNHSLVLEGLQPHPNLRTLKIFDFMGPKFPTWMSNNPSSCLGNLVYLKLSRCHTCKQLPAFGVLPSLRFLEIDGMLHLEEWLDQPSSSSSSSTPSSSSYPLLESLKIYNSPKLKSMPTKFFSLKEFDVLGTSFGMGVSSIVRSNLNTLTKLLVRHVYDGLEFLPLGLLKGNNVLQTLYIKDCHDFKGFNREEEEEEGDEDSSSSNSSLRSLEICGCPDFQGFNRGEGDEESSSSSSSIREYPVLTLLPGNLRGLTSLRRLVVRECQRIELCPMFKSMLTWFPSVEEWELKNGDGLIRGSLGLLNITNIPGLMFLPQGFIGFNRDNNIVLQSLEISDCPDFQRFNRGGDEDLLLLSSSCSSLQKLDLHYCPVLRLLPGDLRGLTSLRSLSIRHCGESNDDHCKSIEMMSDCPMLKSMPTLFPSMESLEFDSCDGKIVTSVLRSNLMDTLTSLTLSNIPGLMFLPLGLLKGNNVIQTLYIWGCPDFQGFIQEVEGDGDLSLSRSSNRSSNNSLRSLFLGNCPVLWSLPNLKDFTSLRSVTIEGCKESLVIRLPNGVENQLWS